MICKQNLTEKAFPTSIEAPSHISSRRSFSTIGTPWKKKYRKPWKPFMAKTSKQEAHGPHCSPEKKVQIIINKQIWLYHNVDSENKEKSLWGFIGSSFEETWIPFTQGCFVPRLVEIGPVVLEKILKFRKCIFAICVIISPWKTAGPFISTT